MTVLDHIELPVADLDAQRDWYVKALGPGASTSFEPTALGICCVFIVHAEQKWAIEPFSRTGSRPGPQAADPHSALLPRGPGHISHCVDGFDAVYDRHIASGATRRMTPRRPPEPGVRMAFDAGPEGHLIEPLDRPWPVGGGLETS